MGKYNGQDINSEDVLTDSMKEVLIQAAMRFDGMDRFTAETKWSKLGQKFEEELAWVLKTYREADEE